MAAKHNNRLTQATFYDRPKTADVSAWSRTTTTKQNPAVEFSSITVDELNNDKTRSLFLYGSGLGAALDAYKDAYFNLETNRFGKPLQSDKLPSYCLYYFPYMIEEQGKDLATLGAVAATPQSVSGYKYKEFGGLMFDIDFDQEHIEIFLLAWSVLNPSYREILKAKTTIYFTLLAGVELDGNSVGMAAIACVLGLPSIGIFTGALPKITGDTQDLVFEQIGDIGAKFALAKLFAVPLVTSTQVPEMLTDIKFESTATNKKQLADLVAGSYFVANLSQLIIVQTRLGMLAPGVKSHVRASELEDPDVVNERARQAQTDNPAAAIAASLRAAVGTCFVLATNIRDKFPGQTNETAAALIRSGATRMGLLFKYQLDEFLPLFLFVTTSRLILKVKGVIVGDALNYLDKYRAYSTMTGPGTELPPGIKTIEPPSQLIIEQHLKDNELVKPKKIIPQLDDDIIAPRQKAADTKVAISLRQRATPQPQSSSQQQYSQQQKGKQKASKRVDDDDGPEPLNPIEYQDLFD